MLLTSSAISSGTNGRTPAGVEVLPFTSVRRISPLLMHSQPARQPAPRDTPLSESDALAAPLTVFSHEEKLCLAQRGRRRPDGGQDCEHLRRSSYQVMRHLAPPGPAQDGAGRNLVARAAGSHLRDVRRRILKDARRERQARNDRHAAAVWCDKQDGRVRDRRHGHARGATHPSRGSGNTGSGAEGPSAAAPDDVGVLHQRARRCVHPVFFFFFSRHELRLPIISPILRVFLFSPHRISLQIHFRRSSSVAPQRSTTAPGPRKRWQVPIRQQGPRSRGTR